MLKGKNPKKERTQCRLLPNKTEAKSKNFKPKRGLSMSSCTKLNQMEAKNRKRKMSERKESEG